MRSASITVSRPASAFASWIAARSVHVPAPVAQAPSPGVASTASAVVSTMKVAAHAGGVLPDVFQAGAEYVAPLATRAAISAQYP